MTRIWFRGRRSQHFLIGSAAFFFVISGCGPTKPPVSPSLVVASTRTPSADSPPTEVSATTRLSPPGAAKATPSATSSPGLDYSKYLFDRSYEFLTAEHDFGHVVQGQKVHHTFSLQNTTSFSMTIGEIRSAISCCVTGKVAKTVLEPGESVDLVITLDSVHQGGPLTVNVVVPTDAQAVPFIYRVSANVEEVIGLEPYFVKLRGDKKVTFQVKSKRYSTGLKITKIVPSDPAVKVTPGPVTGETQAFEVQAGKAQPTQLAFITLSTNDKEIPDIVLQYSIER